MEAARLTRQGRRMIMYKKRMAKMYSTNIVSSKKFEGGSHRSKKHKDIAMIHDTYSCKRARLNRRMLLNLNRTRESSSNAQCLRRSTPSLINVFSHSVVGLNGDVATTTIVQEFGIHLLTNVSALDKHLPTTELTGLGMRYRKPIDIDLSKRVKLPLLKSPPPELQELLQHSEHYKTNIRRFNSMFAMISMGGNVDVHANEGQGPYIFRLNGQNHHRIGSLLPESQYGLDIAIVQILLTMLDENNVSLQLIGLRSSDGREQNMPTCSEVAAIIEARRAANKAYDVAKVDERVNRAVAAANRAANAARVAAVNAIQKQMHHNSNNNIPIPIV
ncbi:hypothetical protein SO802_008976 [Lithocarpus litseifolius]|uniref:Uncharacterized protein n=1 Tax=Lithocarpus litseifolius TaxID=425828 RepID=A0AAW2DBH8_9ROSI